MITFIDTSTWVNARIFGGIEEAAVVKAFDIGVIAGCATLWRELAWVLTRKFNFPAEAITDDLEMYRMFSIETIIDGSIRGSEDPDDDFVLECAVRAQAHVIVSNDLKHLVRMGSFECIPIVTPEKFLLTNYEVDELQIAAEQERCFRGKRQSLL